MAATQCASRASFCLLLDRGDKKGILFKSRQALLESLQSELLDYLILFSIVKLVLLLSASIQVFISQWS